jgi:hypothetical protein
LTGHGNRPGTTIRVRSGTTFDYDGVPCQPLGVAESDDLATRARALDFASRWLSSVGNCIGFYNGSSPLQLADGTCIVWVRGYDSRLSCLNLELVRAGLVRVDLASQEGYTFEVPAKEDDVLEDWQGELEQARQGPRRGEKPEVNFDWPPR